MIASSHAARLVTWALSDAGIRTSLNQNGATYTAAEVTAHGLDADGHPCPSCAASQMAVSITIRSTSTGSATNLAAGTAAVLSGLGLLDVSARPAGHRADEQLARVQYHWHASGVLPDGLDLWQAVQSARKAGWGDPLEVPPDPLEVPPGGPVAAAEPLPDPWACAEAGSSR